MIINNNKTADNFYPKHYNKINISKQIEINNGNNSPMNNSPDRRILPEYKASAKIKNNGRKNGFRIFDKAIEYLNIREKKIHLKLAIQIIQTVKGIICLQ